MKKEFEKEKTKEVIKTKKYIPKTIFGGIAVISLNISVLSMFSNNPWAYYILFTWMLSGIPLMMMSDNIEMHVKREIKKKTNDIFVSYKGKKGERIYDVLEEITFSEIRPTKEEINRINEITNSFNKLQSEEILENADLFKEKLEEYINNLKNRKYLKEENDTEFEDKQKQRLERIIEKHQLKLIYPSTVQSVREMLVKCNNLIKKQSKMNVFHDGLNDITQHLQKIVDKNQEIKEEERKRISSVVSEVIVLAKEYEKPTKEKIETKIREKLINL